MIGHVLDGIDCDLTWSTFCLAFTMFVRKTGRIPTTIFISDAADLKIAHTIIDMFTSSPITLNSIASCNDGTWSVGDAKDRGFGSNGA